MLKFVIYILGKGSTCLALRTLFKFLKGNKYFKALSILGKVKSLESYSEWSCHILGDASSKQ